MNDNTLRPVTGASTVSTIVTPGSNTIAATEMRIMGDGYVLNVVQNERITAFAGAVDNAILKKVIRALDGSREQMLVDAVNNRTRERNYYELYSRLLDNELSDDEFDREIDENPDEYVIPTNKIPTEEEFHEAIALADYIKGIETSSDIASLFSFKGKEFNEYCKRLLDGTL